MFLRHLTHSLAPRLSPLALRQNSEVVHRLDKFTHRIPSVKTADPYRETSKRRKEFIYLPANACQRFCVMDAPEIYQASGLVVVSEFLTAIQANDVSFSAKDRSASEQVGWDCHTGRYRRTPMPMKTDKNKTKQCP
jgi:hypothetical protein